MSQAYLVYSLTGAGIKSFSKKVLIYFMENKVYKPQAGPHIE